MEVRLLGEFAVHDDDGRDVTPTAPKERVLVALLALRAGHVVRIAEVVDALWGDSPPKAAVEAVQTLVARVRRRLGRAPIVGVGGGYRWIGDPSSVDALRLEALIHEASSVMRSAGAAAGGPLLDAALASWDGSPAWDDAVGEELRSAAVRLTELIEVVREDREQARMAAGECEAAVAGLEGLVAATPLRERRWALLMEALYRCGRQVDALRAYQRARTALADVGLWPGPRLVELEAKIIEQDPSLGPPPSRPPAQRRAAPRLIGREDDINRVAAALSPGTLVTVSGTPGVGKTSVARAVMAQTEQAFADGTFWVDLAAISQPSDVPQAVADALGVSSQPRTPLLRSIAAAVEGRRALVVLDNCEHVRAGVAEVVDALREGASPAVLATSRERLGADGERVVPLASLRSDGIDSPAVRLLVERVHNGGAEPDDHDLERLRDIAARLDGVPLALELAAARCRTLGVSEVAHRIGDAVALLGDSTRLTARHRTLEQALGWSYELLTDAQRRVLERLSAFAGTFTLDAAEDVAVAGSMTAVEADDAIASLVEHSLMSHEGRRLRLLEITRQFAARRMADSGRSDEAWRALSHHVERRMVAVHTGLHGPDEAEWVDILDAMWPDVRAVVRRGTENGDADVVISILAHLGVEILYRRPEAFGWVDAAVTKWGDRPGPHRHELLGLAAMSAYTNADATTAVALADAAVAADPAAGTAIDCLPESGFFGAHHFAGQHDLVVQFARRSLDAFPATGSSVDRAMIATVVAIHEVVTKGSEALAAADRAVELAMVTGNPSAKAYASSFQGVALIDQNYARAIEVLRDAHRLAESVRNPWLLDLTASHLATALAARDKRAAAEAFVGLADDAMRGGWVTHAWTSMWNVPLLLFAVGRRSEAALVLGGCEASGVNALPSQKLPDDIKDAIATGEDEGLPQLLEQGRKLGMADLVRVLRAEHPGTPTPPSTDHPRQTAPTHAPSR